MFHILFERKRNFNDTFMKQNSSKRINIHDLRVTIKIPYELLNMNIENKK